MKKRYKCLGCPAFLCVGYLFYPYENKTLRVLAVLAFMGSYVL